MDLKTLNITALKSLASLNQITGRSKKNKDELIRALKSLERKGTLQTNMGATGQTTSPSKYDKKTVAELKEIAKRHKIPGWSKMKKAQLLLALKPSVGAIMSPPPKKRASPVTGAIMSPPQKKRASPVTGAIMSPVSINLKTGYKRLEDMKVVELKTEAKRRGLSGYTKLKKDALVRLLSGSPAASAIGLSPNGMVPLDKWKVPELKIEAERLGATKYKSIKKQELITLIKRLRNANGENASPKNKSLQVSMSDDTVSGGTSRLYSPAASPILNRRARHPAMPLTYDSDDDESDDESDDKPPLYVADNIPTTIDETYTPQTPAPQVRPRQALLFTPTTSPVAKPVAIPADPIIQAEAISPQRRVQKQKFMVEKPPVLPPIRELTDSRKDELLDMVNKIKSQTSDQGSVVETQRFIMNALGL